MIYNAGEKKLNCIRKVFENEVVEVWVAQEIDKDADGKYHTLIVVKDHGTAKRLMKAWEDGLREGRESCGQMPAGREELCIVYPYKKERPLHKFYWSEPRSGKECEQICINLLVECISSGEAWPILYLILCQKQVHIEKDHRIFFSYQLDLTELNEEIGEKDCVVKCARMVLDIMQNTPEMEKTMGMNLIRKKLLKDGYSHFAELFRDIHMDAGAWKKVKLKERIKDFLQAKKGTIIRGLLIISAFLGVVAALMILSQMIFGDIPFLRIFTGAFETIGRESMLK
ncbi:MAG: hypothetical protein HFG89_09045 [Dorea sp.]|jgi:hypothetical protein|nr:hypothetical protein [Dorea sp.]